MRPIRRLRNSSKAFIDGLSPSLFKRVVHTATLAVIMIQLRCLDANLIPWHLHNNNWGVNSNEALNHLKRNIKYQLSSLKREHLTKIWRISSGESRKGSYQFHDSWVFSVKRELHVNSSIECRRHAAQEVLHMFQKREGHCWDQILCFRVFPVDYHLLFEEQNDNYRTLSPALPHMQVLTRCDWTKQGDVRVVFEKLITVIVKKCINTTLPRYFKWWNNLLDNIGSNTYRIDFNSQW